MHWTTPVWRLLCLLTTMSALLAVTGTLWALPPLLLGAALLPGGIVTLLVAVASYSDWSHSHTASTKQ